MPLSVSPVRLALLQPRGLGAAAKTLSMDMRVEDCGWLNMKLAVLEKSAGDNAFMMASPPSGDKHVETRTVRLSGGKPDGDS